MAVCLMTAFLLVNSVWAAGPPPKHAGIEPTGNEATREVTIPKMPVGKLLNVVVWNDCNRTKAKYLGSVQSLTLKTCDSCSFIWEDSDATQPWQLVTPTTKPGGDLQAIYHPEGWKYGFKDADVNKK